MRSLSDQPQARGGAPGYINFAPKGLLEGAMPLAILISHQRVPGAMPLAILIRPVGANH